jgi:hypothetical protein
VSLQNQSCQNLSFKRTFLSLTSRLVKAWPVKVGLKIVVLLVATHLQLPICPDHNSTLDSRFPIYVKVGRDLSEGYLNTTNTRSKGASSNYNVKEPHH